jgi:RecB family exonuclease
MRISYSQCSSYQICPHQYRLHYVDRISVPAAVELHFGSAVHEALKVMYDPGHVRMPSLEEVLIAFDAAWQARRAQVDEERRQSYFEQGVAMLQRHYEKHSTREQGRCTAATELFFSLPFDLQHTLTGRIDRVDVLPDDALEVVDYKTSRRMPPQARMEKDAQLAIYRMAADQLYPGRQVTTTLLYVFHDYEMRMTQTPEFLAEKQDEIRDVIAGIQVGDFDPPGRGHRRAARRVRRGRIRGEGGRRPREPAEGADPGLPRPVPGGARREWGLCGGAPAVEAGGRLGRSPPARPARAGRAVGSGDAGEQHRGAETPAVRRNPARPAAGAGGDRDLRRDTDAQSEAHCDV